MLAGADLVKLARAQLIYFGVILEITFIENVRKQATEQNIWILK
jgi:hypothetical protein